MYLVVHSLHWQSQPGASNTLEKAQESRQTARNAPANLATVLLLLDSIFNAHGAYVALGWRAKAQLCRTHPVEETEKVRRNYTMLLEHWCTKHVIIREQPHSTGGARAAAVSCAGTPPNGKVQDNNVVVRSPLPEVKRRGAERDAGHARSARIAISLLLRLVHRIIIRYHTTI